jgi:hypothetical protein
MLKVNSIEFISGLNMVCLLGDIPPHI